MFRDFYRDAEELHRLVEPLRYYRIQPFIESMTDGMMKLKQAIGENLVVTFDEASANIVRLGNVMRKIDRANSISYVSGTHWNNNKFSLSNWWNDGDFFVDTEYHVWTRYHNPLRRLLESVKSSIAKS